MVDIIAVSRKTLAGRRKKLRQQRRQKLLTAIWRMAAFGGIAGGLVWAITLPGWLIRKPEQVTIVGNEYLSEKAIRSLLPLNYPQSLLRVQPGAIATKLEMQAPIASAQVTRHLFPPGLTVEIKERLPVAIVEMANNNSKNNTNNSQLQLLDANGFWMSLESYTALKKTQDLPTLKIIGMREQYRPYWPQLYQSLSNSPVKILEINWQYPANLILKTELGAIHLGPYSQKFPQQLQIIDRMRQLPQHINTSQIDYIDIKNPDIPPKIQMRIQTRQSQPAAKPQTP